MSCALPERPTRIAIVGAGIGGLMFAASLGEGYQIDIFDHRSSLNGDGFGLNIQPIAVSELAGLGVLSRLCSLGIQTRAHRYLSSDGQQIMEEPRGRFAGEEMPQLSILRQDLVSTAEEQQDVQHASHSRQLARLSTGHRSSAPGTRLHVS